MRPLLFPLILVASAAQAQPAGWTIDSQKNAQAPAAYRAVATRAVGASKLVYERSMLNGVNYRVEHDGCTSSSGGAGNAEDPAERLTEVVTAMTNLVRDKDNFCKLPAASIKALPTGLRDAIAAADAAYERDRPTITVTPRTATKDGWTIEDAPGTAYDGLVGDHILTIRKASGPILLTYTNQLFLDADKVSAGQRSMTGKVRDCDYGDSDYNDLISVNARAGAVRKQIEGGLATTGYDVTDAQIKAGMAGFEAAFAMLETWAIERLDERRALLAAAGGSGMSAMDAAAAGPADAMEAMSSVDASSSAADAAGKAAACAEAKANGWMMPEGC